MSYYELQNETFKATREFYSIPQILKRALRFDLFNMGLKAYGRGVAKTWKQKNKYFFDYTKAITDAGNTIELAAKKTAEDLKEKFRKIQRSGASAHQKTQL
jgi:pyruvate-formate lyase-activating enzyme